MMIETYAPQHPLDFKGQGLWAWWDFTDTNALFVEEDRTVPVTANLDEIGWVEDKSGNGRHLYQGTSTARPLYRTNQVNGLGCAGFASVGSGASDDFLNITLKGASGSNILMGHTMIVVDNHVAAGNLGILGAASNGWRAFYATDVLTAGKAGVANVVTASTGTTRSAWRCTFYSWTGADKAYAETNGGSALSNHTVTAQTQTVDTLLFGALTGPASFYDGYMGEVLLLQNLSLTDLKGLLRNYIRPKFAVNT